ncbi:hypothetical protein RDn1_286 [Candidatus Termititenax dinenymphae]|uniref:Uncharacterized protein n=1 Tax=Candidatus Termititenax dinenymphae TaxID=2218523 RepID=A0A388TJX7_9BACT|nr:hypothetical protein RDn1_286 [Candidatus Termititenax dinenymphae]
MTKEMTLSFDEDIYSGLMKMFGVKKINTFISDLVRPYVVPSSLDDGYQAMATDQEHEQEAQEWCNALLGDINK